MSIVPAGALEAAEAELLDWTHGGHSYWNQLHGSVTGDYNGMFERTASADAAEIAKLTNKVIALRLLLAPGPKNF